MTAIKKASPERFGPPDKRSWAVEVLQDLVNADHDEWYEVETAISSQAVNSTLYRIAGMVFTPLEIKSKHGTTYIRWNTKKDLT